MSAEASCRTTTRIRSIWVVVVGMVLAALLIGPTAARALSPGDFDPTFATDGLLSAKVGEGIQPSAELSALAAQSDGKTLLAGRASAATGIVQVLLARVSANGALDPSFAAGGTLLAQLGETKVETFSAAKALALQGDGKIVLGGYADDASGHDLALLGRVDANGILDPTFATNGKLLVQLGAGPKPLSIVNALAVQADGKIVLGGVGTDASDHEQVVLARVNADGTLDSTFGTEGKLLVQLGGGANPFSAIWSLAPQSDGKIVVGGGATDATGHERVLLARVNANGTFDSTFGTDGKLVVQLGDGPSSFSSLTSLALQKDGKIVFGGTAGDASRRDAMMLARVDANGSFDPTFGPGPQLVVQVGESEDPFSGVEALALQNDGKIVVGGFATDSSEHETIFGANSGFEQLMLARVDADGSLDSSFASHGILLAQPGLGAEPLSNLGALALQGDGKIVLGGESTDAGGIPQLLAARVLGTAPELPVGAAPAPALMPALVPARAPIPRLSRASMSHRRFRIAKRATAVSARSGAPLGTSFAFTLSTDAKVTIAITRTAPGLRSGRRCVAANKSPRRRRARRCVRRLTVGTLIRANERSGADLVAFSGRIGRRALPPATYMAALIASGLGGRSTPVTLPFVVVR